VVLDNSLSTTAVSGGAPTFDALRDAAAATLSRGSVGDRLWLVTADGQVRGGSAAELARLAAATRPLDGAGALRAAVERAAALARGAGLPAAAVAIATDGQASAWRAPPAAAGVRLDVLVPSAPPPSNHGLAGVASRPFRWTPSGTVAARVVGVGDSVAWRIDVGGGAGASRTLARGSTPVGAAGDSTAGQFQARVAPSDRGWLAGTVVLTPDEFRGDDSAFFAASVEDPPAVRASTDAGQFVVAAVASLTASGQARAAGSRPVLVAPADAAFTLPAVLFAPASPVGVGAANRALARAGVPWRFGAPRSGPARLQSAAGGLSLGEAQASLRYALEPVGVQAEARVLATAAGEPWAVAGPGYVLVASPADPSATSLPVLAPWVPWLTAAVAAASGAGVSVVVATPNAPVAAPPGATALVTVAGAPVAAIRSATIAAPAVRGVYFFTRGAGAAVERVGALVVNLEAEELVLERVREDDLARRLRAAGGRGAPEVLVTHDASDWTRSAYSGGKRRPIAAVLLAGALLALFVESAFARAGRRRSAAGAA